MDKQDVNEIKEQLCGDPLPKGQNEPKWDLGLSTGSTLLNLACSGRPNVGFAPDYYYVWCGRSGSGKTFVTLTTLAEASINPSYGKHRLIYDAPEAGALMSFEKYYGPEMARRVEPPAGTKDNPEHSQTLEEFYHNVFNALQKGPFVYLLDSMDALPTDEEFRDFMKKNRKRNKVAKKGAKESEDEEEGTSGPTKEAGSYGMQRAKANSHYLRMIYNQLQGSNSILIVIFQSRQSISFGYGDKDTRGGGLAPTFYCGLELWSKVATHLKTEYGGNPVEQGVVCEVRVKKGRLTGKDRTVNIPIFHSSGIDDIGGMVDFLVEWGRWKKTGKAFDPQDGRVSATELGKELQREKLVQFIMDKGHEKELKELVKETWEDIEKVCAVERKSKYHKG